MPTQHNIKWRIQDEEELRRVARNFNRKLNRIESRSPELSSVLPQFYNQKTEEFEKRITVDLLKSMIQTRQDYNRYLNMLKRFSKRGAEDIVVAPGNEYNEKITRWQRDEMLKLKRTVNLRRKVRLEQLNAVQMINSAGPLGYTLGEMFGMGLASVNKLQPVKAFTRGQTKADIRFKMFTLQNEARDNYYKDRDQLLKDNYIGELVKNFNEEDVKDIINTIQNMDNNVFVLKFQARGDKFEMVYPPERGTQGYKNYVEELHKFWMGNTNTALDLAPALVPALLSLGRRKK